MAFKDCSVKVTIFQFYLQDGRTALHYTAEKGNTDLVELLIQHGSDIMVKDKVRIKFETSNDKTSFICHFSSRSLGIVVHKVVSKCNWMRIHI